MLKEVVGNRLSYIYTSRAGNNSDDFIQLESYYLYTDAEILRVLNNAKMTKSGELYL